MQPLCKTTGHGLHGQGPAVPLLGVYPGNGSTSTDRRAHRGDSLHVRRSRLPEGHPHVGRAPLSSAVSPLCSACAKPNSWPPTNPGAPPSQAPQYLHCVVHGCPHQGTQSLCPNCPPTDPPPPEGPRLSPCFQGATGIGSKCRSDHQTGFPDSGHPPGQRCPRSPTTSGWAC